MTLQSATIVSACKLTLYWMVRSSMIQNQISTAETAVVPGFVPLFVCYKQAAGRRHVYF
jgi:hypothetical protein